MPVSTIRVTIICYHLSRWLFFIIMQIVTKNCVEIRITVLISIINTHFYFIGTMRKLFTVICIYRRPTRCNICFSSAIWVCQECCFVFAVGFSVLDFFRFYLVNQHHLRCIYCQWNAFSIFLPTACDSGEKSSSHFIIISYHIYIFIRCIHGTYLRFESFFSWLKIDYLSIFYLVSHAVSKVKL